MSLILGALGGLGEGMASAGAQMQKEAFQRDRDLENRQYETEKLKLAESLREKSDIAKESRLEDRKVAAEAKYQGDWEASKRNALDKLGQADAAKMTGYAGTLSNIDPSTGQPGAFAGQPVTQADIDAMPPEGRAVYEKLGIIPKRTESLIASAHADEARAMGASPELRKELFATAKEATAKEEAAAKLELSERGQRTRDAVAEAQINRLNADAAAKGNPKAMDQAKLDSISQGVHRISANLTDGMKDPYAVDTNDKEGSKDHLAKGILNSYLSRGVVNAALKGDTVNPDEAGAQILSKIRQADAIVRKQAAAAAKTLFEGKEALMFGKNSPDKDAIEEAKKQGIPEEALASPIAFQKFYREQHLEETFLKVASESKSSAPRNDKPKESAPQAKPAVVAKEAPTKVAEATQDQDIGMTGLSDLAIQRIANDPSNPRQKVAQEYIMKQAAARSKAQAERVNDDQFNPEYYK